MSDLRWERNPKKMKFTVSHITSLYEVSRFATLSIIRLRYLQNWSRIIFILLFGGRHRYGVPLILRYFPGRTLSFFLATYQAKLKEINVASVTILQYSVLCNKEPTGFRSSKKTKSKFYHFYIYCSSFDFYTLLLKKINYLECHILRDGSRLHKYVQLITPHYTTWLSKCHYSNINSPNLLFQSSIPILKQ